ncbi:hypothetical protein NYZ99_04740 [Maribacter litopenaei]|uniref:Uncharacterized protein n=1 Tax=Maribacter litopenaei TaxID=2976127 RepID=A0ABY5Y9N5_9FLAO|nr:hypothetical protein [Maribacter litopenaei]UWX55736.1 hypothetical protein NYZ99_04740 [Maribacter litopenaei]
MNHSLNIEESFDSIILFFFSDFQTKEFKEFTKIKIKNLSPYQYYHLLGWLLENIKDDILLANLDIIFDFSALKPKKYLPTEPGEVTAFNEPVEGPVLPNRFGKDCIKFFRMGYGTIKNLKDEVDSFESINRFILYYKAEKCLIEPQVDYERLLHLMSMEERLCFPVYDFPNENSAPFYGHAINYLRRNVEQEVKSLKQSLEECLCKEGEKIKKMFLGKSKQSLPMAFMTKEAMVLPILMGFEQWKRLVLDSLYYKKYFTLLKARILFLLDQLQEVIKNRYFQDLTSYAKRRGLIVEDKETGIRTLKSLSPPMVNSYEYRKWLKNLKLSDLNREVKVEVEKPSKNQIIISKTGSQLKLKKALLEFFAHIKLRIDEERDRALESFVYRNFSYEYDEKTDYSKRTVNNFGYKPMTFIPSEHAKDFTKLLLYLSDKDYLVSNKTQIIRMLDDDIHEKNGKDGFSYSSLIRIPSDEHHLFPDDTIRRRVRSILRIDN